MDAWSPNPKPVHPEAHVRFSSTHKQNEHQFDSWVLAPCYRTLEEMTRFQRKTQQRAQARWELCRLQLRCRVAHVQRVPLLSVPGWRLRVFERKAEQLVDHRFRIYSLGSAGQDACPCLVCSLGLSFQICRKQQPVSASLTRFTRFS